MRFLHLARIVILPIVIAPVLLFVFQDRMIYHPRPYDAAQLVEFHEKLRRVNRVEGLDYVTSQGPQWSYYVPPKSGLSGELPTSIWVLFNGNGSLALDWMNLVNGYPGSKDAFLLVEYPGYGNSSGKPSPDAIQESAIAALGVLASRLNVNETELEPRLKVLGHSLGAAAALGFAARHPQVSRVVLLAPFSSMGDMARRTVGVPLCYLLRDNYDNRAWIRVISARTPTPEVEILAGTQDNLIPCDMGRELAALAPKAAHFQAVDGVGHATIVDQADLIYDAMGGKAGVAAPGPASLISPADQ